MNCPYCRSAAVRCGFRKTNLGRKQMYLCRKCGKFTPEWNKMRFRKSDVMYAVKLYKSGLSAGKVKNQMESRGVTVSRWTILKWYRKFG